MDRPLLMALVVAFLLILLALMYVGWRRRQRRQAGIPKPQSVPEGLDAAALTVSGFYVATTVADEPLNRIAVAGLGYRARARVSVHASGLVLAIPGQAPIFVPAADIRSVQKATWAIDRAVEQDGLVLVRWKLGAGGSHAVEVDSYLRVGVDSDTFFTAVRELHAAFHTPHDTQAGGRAQ